MMNCLECNKEIKKGYCSNCVESAVEKAIDDAQWEADQIESERVENIEYAAFATGMPDLFSDEMRGFWNA